MKPPKQISPKAKAAKVAERERYDAQLAQRINIKRQYEHELANPQEYAEMETQLREWLRNEDFEIEEWADKTILHWGHNPRLSFQAHTRGAAIKGVWQDEATKRTIPKRTAQ